MDMHVQLVAKNSHQPVYLPDVKLKLYVVDGQPLSAPDMVDSVPAVYKADDGKPLFTVSGVAPEADAGVPLELTQVSYAYCFCV